METPNPQMDRDIIHALGKQIPPGQVWSPSSDATAAWEVVEEVCKKLKCDFKLHRSQTMGILARFDIGQKTATVTLSRHSSLPEAICEAAIAALRETSSK